MRKIYFLIILTVLLLVTTISGCWGSPEFTIIFENKTQEALTIYYGDYKVGSVDSDKQITYNRASWNTGQYQIEATDLQGDIVYSKKLTREMMEKIETMVYKVIITSTANATNTQY